MKENKNISSVNNCYGCGVCSSVCAKELIGIRLNPEGFYEPYIIDEQLCTNCGLCTDVCAFLHKERFSSNSKPIKCWAAWSDDENIRRKCSSGGVAYEIGKQLINKGYNAISVKYNVEKKRSEHYISESIDEFKLSIGSKYIQSYTCDAFKRIDRKKKNLVIGTPCQIDSLRRMINKYRCEDNFILMDFFCHSVPSYLAWKAYITKASHEVGRIINIKWRDKEYLDWHDSYSMRIEGLNGSVMSPWNKGDMFYRLFLGDLCLGRHCQKDCKYKYDKSSADIRIGDLWGKTYQCDKKGVNALIAFTEKGLNAINGLEGVTLIEHPFDIVAEGQMKENAKAKEIYPFVMHLLRKETSLDSVLYKTLLFIQRVITRIKIILNK